MPDAYYDPQNVNINDPTNGGVPFLKAPSADPNAAGAYNPSADPYTGMISSDQGHAGPQSYDDLLKSSTGAAGALRNQFTQAYGNTPFFTPPAVTAAPIDTTQGNQARNLAMGGLDIQKNALNTQAAGGTLQQTGAGVQASGLGGINAGLGAAGDAAQSYRDVLAGKTPSVAELTGQKLLGQGIAAGFGGANSVGGPNRTLALRSAINGAGAAGAAGATQAGILRAGEQDAARSGLLGAAGALNTGGVSTTGVGTGLANTGAGLANTGVGMANTGAGITSGANATRAGDTTIAAGDAGNKLTASADTAGNAVTANGQNNMLHLGEGSLANTASGNETTGAASGVTGALNRDQFNAAKDPLTPLKSVLGDFGISSDEVKTDVAPAGGQQMSDLFKSFATGMASGPTKSAQPGSSLIGAQSYTDPLKGDIKTGEQVAELIATSSRKVKDDVQPDPKMASRMFAQIQPTTWKYDDAKMAQRGLPEPPTEGGKHLGVIAENVEKAGPLGKGMVTEVNGTKALDIPMAVSALMAAMADIQKRRQPARSRG